jgi:predicted transcriptional regulator
MYTCSPEGWGKPPPFRASVLDMFPFFTYPVRREGQVTLREVKEILEAEVVVGGDQLDKEIRTGASADLMSDVLAFAQSGCLLLTGLTNPQIVRTSDVLDIAAIVLVRGKRPLPETIQLAEELRIPILLTRYILYEAVGRLYAKGVVGCVQKVVKKRDFS